ncbi:PREDICTED: SH3 domain-containing protein 21 [Elephantulus edwardii]|uniref:SH3 domain-containing protein 21 n=1 Tax=Elephantulus edwardii TaxID=28737 RepID=UPI0003F06EC1|nr:PREDICTED: SH3 domain-containing protein 21 [Elephantulus edwardii]
MEVLVLYRYRAQKEGELNLVPGDVVRQVHRGPARGWLRGELGKQRGLFPERLVQEIPENLRGITEAQKPRCARSRGHPAKSRGPQRWCKVNFNYSPEQADELMLQVGEMVEVLKEIEDGWWLGQKNGQLGAFPSNFVELLDSGPPSLDNTDTPSICPYSQRPAKLSSLTYDSPPDYLRTVSHPETYRVLFDYQPEAPDELELRRGDVVKVLRKTTEDKGWWEGECQGKRGVFPDNFVLPPPPIKKLLPRKAVSREPASAKEQKKMMSKTALPTVKKLVTPPTGPGKAKPSRTPNGESQKHPSCDSGSNGRLPAGIPGKKRSKIQGSRQCSALSQEEEQSSLAKNPSVKKSPTLDKTPKAEKTPYPDKATSPEKTQTLNKDSPSEKAPTLDMTPSPEKALTLDKASTSENILTQEEPPPEKNVTPDRAPSPENIPTLNKTLNHERVFSVDETSALKIPPEEAGPGLEMAPPGDEMPSLDETSIPDQVPPEDVTGTGHNTQLHHFSPEGALQEGPPVAKEFQPQEDEMDVFKDAPECISTRVKLDLNDETDNPPLQSDPESMSSPDEPHSQNEATTLLRGTPVEDEATSSEETALKEEPPLKAEMLPQKEVSPMEEAPPKEEMSSLKEEASREEAAPKEEITPQKAVFPIGEAPPEKEVPPNDLAPAPKKLDPIKSTTDPQDTHSRASQNPTESKDDKVDIVRLKDEVESLRKSLDLMGELLEKKLTSIWEELKSEREHRQLLEVQLMQRTQEASASHSVHSQTETN